jgi:uncharacterized protein YndB with AHSA1/START domain
VWEAITSDEHLNCWLLRQVSVEPREGGRCSFTWGGDEEQVGVVRDVEPPRRIVYDLETSYLRFELEPVDGGTRLVLVHGFTPGAHLEPQDWPGGDQPGGEDCPWRPGFSQGFHVMLDALGILLDGAAPAFENVLDWLAATGNDLDAVVDEHVSTYREHIREHCPPA